MANTIETMLENEEFLAKVENANTDEEVQALLTEYDVEIPENESDELGETDLEKVAGGALLTAAGVAEAFYWVWTHGGGSVVKKLVNTKTIKAYYICAKANSDAKKGNMYKTYSKSTVNSAINTLDSALKKFGF